MIFKRGRVYWFEFIYNGERIRKSTRQHNARAAKDIAAAYRTTLAKGEAGLERRPNPPTLVEFEPRFSAWIEQSLENLSTRRFYHTAYKKLLEFAPLARTRLDLIDEPLIEGFKCKLLTDGLSKTTANRYLATLRKALRYASRRLKLFDRLPVITMYPDERQREFIFSDTDFKNWIAMAPEPLRSASVLARNCGICRGEMLALERDSITLHDVADDDGMFGRMEIKRGLKRKERRRILPINREMREVLLQLLARSRCEHVFTAREDPAQPLSTFTLSIQMSSTRNALKLHDDAGLHTLRHTFLTEMGRRTDAFTLQKIAGHKRITTTQRYVHPQQDAIARAFAIREQGRLEVPTKVPTVERDPKRTSVYN